MAEQNSNTTKEPTIPEVTTIPKVTTYETIKGTEKKTNTLSEVGRKIENTAQSLINFLSYGVNGVTLSSDRTKRWIQEKVGVSDAVLQDRFKNVYEWEAKNPKKTKAISQIQETQKGDRAVMNDKSSAPQDKAVSSVSEMIKEIIINMLGGTTHRDAVNYHNSKNKDYKIDEGSDLDNLIKKIFSNVKDDIKNGQFNVNSIDNDELSNAIKKHISIAGKTDDQLKKQVESTIKQRATEEYSAKKEGFKAVGDALQERKKKLEKYLKNTEINSLSDTTNNQKKTSEDKIAQYKKELEEIDVKIAENTENNLKNDQEINDALKSDTKEAELDSKAKIVDVLKGELSKLEKRLGKMEGNFKDQEGVLTKSGEVKFQNDITVVEKEIEKLKGNIKEAELDLEAAEKASAESTKKLTTEGSKLEKAIEVNKELLATKDISQDIITELETKNAALQKKIDDLKAKQSEDVKTLNETKNRFEESTTALGDLEKPGSGERVIDQTKDVNSKVDDKLQSGDGLGTQKLVNAAIPNTAVNNTAAAVATQKITNNSISGAKTVNNTPAVTKQDGANQANNKHVSTNNTTTKHNTGAQTASTVVNEQGAAPAVAGKTKTSVKSSPNDVNNRPAVATQNEANLFNKTNNGQKATATNVVESTTRAKSVGAGASKKPESVDNRAVKSAPPTGIKEQRPIKKTTTHQPATTVAEKPKTRFQQTQQKINEAKTKLLDTKKGIVGSVKQQTKKNRDTIAENKKTEKKITGPMSNSAFGSKVPQKKSSQQGCIKNPTKKIASSAVKISGAKGGPKVPATGAGFTKKTTKVHGGL